MGLNKLGPAAGGKKLPTREQLQRENERLKEKIKILEAQLEDTQLALCDVYEAMLAGGEL